jgi:hypothetical protein
MSHLIKKERDGFYDNAAGEVIGNNAADDFKRQDKGNLGGAEYDEFMYFDALGTGQNIDIADTALFQYAPEDKFFMGVEYIKTMNIGLLSARIALGEMELSSDGKQ